jgi:oxygen-independent coproporphyrinogen-3 oxidase
MPETVPIRHLYVHIPFCRSRCAYCDFSSEPIGSHVRAGRVEAYAEGLLAELRERTASAGGGRPTSGDGTVDLFETIYLGGGTPTVLPRAELLALVTELARRQTGFAGPEFTIEANPGTIDAQLLEQLGEAGVTRVSLGVQSFAPALRATLGRRTEQRDLETALRDLRAACAAVEGDASQAGAGPRLREWNVDLVFGIPGQSWADAAADIDIAVAAGPTHISLYDLTYTPAFASRVERTGGAGAQEAAGAFAEECLPAAAARLESAGYRRYEVSNFALPGHECRHNLAYWRGEDYLGIGAAAVSTVGSERRTNPVSVAGYLAGRAPSIEIVEAQTRLWEKAMLVLRTAEGVAEAEVLGVLDPVALERLVAQDCVRRGCGRLRLNPAFLDVSNTIISTLLASPEGS